MNQQRVYSTNVVCKHCLTPVSIQIRTITPISESKTFYDIMYVGLLEQDCATHRNIVIDIDGYLRRSEHSTAIIQCEFQDVVLEGYELL